MRQSCKIVANLFQWSEVRLLGNPSAFIHTLNLRVMVMVGHHESLVLGKSVAKVERTKGGKYLDKGQGRRYLHLEWHYKHGSVRSHCKECHGTFICEHGRTRSRCNACGGGVYL